MKAKLVSLLCLSLALCSNAAIVVGDLKDISIQTLDTPIVFAPTNEVLVTSSGLSAGPPAVTVSSSGHFSIVLEAGNYTVSLPLIPWRNPFQIAVFDTNGTVNITNLLTAPKTYTYTNNLNYTVKATSNDLSPDFLDRKISVSGSITKTLVTNSGAISLVLSDSGGSSGPLHVNLSRVSAWSTNGETSLLDSAVTLGAGNLTGGKTIVIEAFGAFEDPAANAPVVTLKLKVGSTIVTTQARGTGVATWHLRALLTVRSAGSSGVVAAALGLTLDDYALPSWSYQTQTATVDTTGALALDLTASVQDFTQAERVFCDQLAITQ